VASYFHHLGVPIIMGGIHATMCLDEAMEQRGATPRAADQLCGQSLIQAQQSSILQSIRGLQESAWQLHDCLREKTGGCLLQASKTTNYQIDG
jgi:hypothetical protein